MKIYKTSHFQKEQSFLKPKQWSRIYVLNGNIVLICDNYLYINNKKISFGVTQAYKKDYNTLVLVNCKYQYILDFKKGLIIKTKHMINNNQIEQVCISDDYIKYKDIQIPNLIKYDIEEYTSTNNKEEVIYYSTILDSNNIMICTSKSLTVYLYNNKLEEVSSDIIYVQCNDEGQNLYLRGLDGNSDTIVTVDLYGYVSVYYLTEKNIQEIQFKDLYVVEEEVGKIENDDGRDDSFNILISKESTIVDNLLMDNKEDNLILDNNETISLKGDNSKDINMLLSNTFIEKKDNSIINEGFNEDNDISNKFISKNSVICKNVSSIKELNKAVEINNVQEINIHNVSSNKELNITDIPFLKKSMSEETDKVISDILNIKVNKYSITPKSLDLLDVNDELSKLYERIIKLETVDKAKEDMESKLQYFISRTQLKGKVDNEYVKERIRYFDSRIKEKLDIRPPYIYNKGIIEDENIKLKIPKEENEEQRNSFCLIELERVLEIESPSNIIIKDTTNKKVKNTTKDTSINKLITKDSDVKHLTVIQNKDQNRILTPPVEQNIQPSGNTPIFNNIPQFTNPSNIPVSSNFSTEERIFNNPSDIFSKGLNSGSSIPVIKKEESSDQPSPTPNAFSRFANTRNLFK